MKHRYELNHDDLKEVAGGVTRVAYVSYAEFYTSTGGYVNTIQGFSCYSLSEAEADLKDTLSIYKNTYRGLHYYAITYIRKRTANDGYEDSEHVTVQLDD